MLTGMDIKRYLELAYKSLSLCNELSIISPDIIWAVTELESVRKNLKFAKVTFCIEDGKVTTLKTESTKKLPPSK